jgi:hypothetical protein
MKWLFGCVLALALSSNLALAQNLDPCGPDSLSLDIGPRPKIFVTFDFSSKGLSSISGSTCLDPNQKYEIVGNVVRYGTASPVVGEKFDLLDSKLGKIGAVSSDENGNFKADVYLTGSNQASEGPVFIFPLLFTTKPSGSDPWSLCSYTTPGLRKLAICGTKSQDFDPIEQTIETAKKLSKASSKKNKNKNKNKNKGKNKRIQVRLG